MIDESILVLPLLQLADEHRISRQVLTERIKAHGITLLFHRPTNTTVWVSARAHITNPPFEIRTVQSILRPKKGGTPFNDSHDHYRKVERDINFFSIDSSEWEEITATGQVTKRSFEEAFLYSRSHTIETTPAYTLFHESISPLRALAVKAELFITSSSKEVRPDEITVTEREVLIQRDDALKLVNETCQPRDFRREEWMSDNLFLLNQASSIFLASNDITAENKVSRLKEIKKWLRGKLSNQGIDLIHQAALSLLPAELYEMTAKGTVSPDITKKYPAHASVSLVMINEAAIHFWNLRNDNFQKNYDKKHEVVKYLTNEDHKMTRRLASAAFTIIKLPDLNITCPRDLAI